MVDAVRFAIRHFRPAARQARTRLRRINHDFWTFTPANPSSSYLNRYHVRFGPAENPAVSVRDDGFFTVHYVHMAAELWLDSTEGWLAVVDGASQYAMVERFQYEENKPYPGKASVIFWTNGPEIRLNGRRNCFGERGSGRRPLSISRPRSIVRCAGYGPGRVATSRRSGFRREPAANSMA